MVQYANRGGWQLRVRTGIDLEDTSPTTCQVLVKNPDGTTKTLTMTVEAPASGGIIVRDVDDADFPDAGAYVLHANVQRTSDASLLPPGEAVHLEIHELYQ